MVWPSKESGDLQKSGKEYLDGFRIGHAGGSGSDGNSNGGRGGNVHSNGKSNGSSGSKGNSNGSGNNGAIIHSKEAVTAAQMRTRWRVVGGSPLNKIVEVFTKKKIEPTLDNILVNLMQLFIWW